MLQTIIEIPETGSIKDKRRVVQSIRDRLQRAYKLSCAEVDLNESLRFAQLGAAIVSNSKAHGESVLQKAVSFLEDRGDVRIHELQIHTEFF
jgi:uncharacterized protein YlxP (DUF503 family)